MKLEMKLKRENKLTEKREAAMMIQKGNCIINYISNRKKNSTNLNKRTSEHI